MENPYLKRRDKSGYTTTVPAVDQAAKVLISMAKSQETTMRLTDIFREVDISASKAFSILATLNKYGFIEKDPQTKTYSLGLGLLFLARRVLDRLDIRDIVTPFVEELSKQTRKTVFFGLNNEEHVFVVAKREGDPFMDISIRLGQRFDLTFGALGKAIVAFLSETEMEKILSKKNLFFYGDPSRMDKNRLTKELEQCRKRGFAEERGDIRPGIHAVSAPVMGPGGKVIGCLTLIGTFAETLAEKYGHKVADTGKRISDKFTVRI